MRQLIWVSVVVLLVSVASQAAEEAAVSRPPESAEAVNFFTATGAMATNLFLGEVEFRAQGAPLAVRAYQLVGKTTCHPFTPDTATPSKLTDTFKPATSVCRVDGPWVGFADTVRHITIEFDLGEVGAVEAFELTYLRPAVGADRPDRVRFFASLDGKFTGRGWGTDSDAELPVPEGAYYAGDFPAAALGSGGQQTLLTLPRPARARYIRLVFSYDMAPNLVLSDTGRCDLSDLYTSRYPLWPVTGQPGQIQSFGAPWGEDLGGQIGTEGLHAGPPASPPASHSPEGPLSPAVTPGETIVIPEPVTAAILTLSGLALFPRRRAGRHH